MILKKDLLEKAENVFKRDRANAGTKLAPSILIGGAGRDRTTAPSVADNSQSHTTKHTTHTSYTYTTPTT